MMKIENLLSVWALTPQRHCIPVSYDRAVAELEALIPTKSGQELLDGLIIDHLVEVNYSGEYILTKKGLQIRTRNIAVPTSNKKISKRTGNEWNRFRKILSYYIDCVHLQERTQEYLSAKDLNRRFFIPVLPFHWLKELGEKSTFNITITSKQYAAALILSTRKDDDEEIYLGYPVSAFQTKSGDETLYTPIGLIPLDIRSVSKTQLEITLRQDEAEINQTWLEFAYPPEEYKSVITSILRIHAHDEHRGKIDLLQALPLLNPGKEMDPDSTDTILPILHNREERQICNTPIIFIGKPLKYSKTLKRELKYIRDEISDEELDKTALAYIFREPLLPTEKTDQHLMPIPFIDSNPEQMEAIETALNTSSTKITGPPGTGKSQVAVNIIANFILNGKKVLFTSRNHKAVEAIMGRSETVLPKKQLPLINFCTQDNNNQAWYTQDLDTLMENAKATLHDTDSSSNAWLTDELERWSLIAQNNRPREALLTDYESCRKILDQVLEKMNQLIPTDDSLPLPSSDFRVLKRYISNLKDPPLLSFSTSFQWIIWKMYGHSRHSRAVEFLQKNYPVFWNNRINLQDLRMTFSKFEQAFGEYLVYKKKQGKLEKKADALPDIHLSEVQLAKIMKKISVLARPALQSYICIKIQELSDNPDLVNRLKSIMTFMKYATTPAFFQRLDSKTAHEAEDGFKIYSKYYPAWAVTLLSLTKASPCIAHHFDTVIIDEASQCDPASVIPALFRSKSVVFIGDSMQFPPVIDMYESRNDYLKSKNHMDDIEDQRFDFKKVSAFDLSSVYPILLKEHFRCAEEIADYFNETFYGNQLHVRTDKQKLKIPVGMGFQHAVTWIDVPNSKEDEIKSVEEILNKLLKIKYRGSIGIVTPFREYANELETRFALVKQKIENNIENAETEPFLINTANGFQGGERDVIIFVLGYNDSLKHGGFWYMESTENNYIYNVAVSRARACLIIIGDKKRCANSSCKPLAKLAMMPKEKTKHKPKQQFDSIWEEKLFEALQKEGIKTIPQYPLIGRRLDLAYTENDVKIDIEIDGVQYHTTSDGHRKLDDYFRDLQIGAMGWEIKRFWVHQLRDDMPKCVKEIREIIKKSSQTNNNMN